MKKLMLILAVGALFTACHSTTESDIQTSDSLVLKASMDSIEVVDSTTVDSVKIDTTK